MATRQELVTLCDAFKRTAEKAIGAEKIALLERAHAVAERIEAIDRDDAAVARRLNISTEDMKKYGDVKAMDPITKELIMHDGTRVKSAR